MSAATVDGLRPYQVRAIAEVRAAYRSHRRVLLVMPTGGGKTHCAATIMRWAAERGRRVVFLVHRREIVLDTVRRLRAAGIACGVVMAGERETDASVQVASVQTIAARDLHLPADLLVWDEAHHTAAATYKAIAAKYPAAWHLGLTATPERADGQGLRDAFDHLVIGATPAELVEAGALAPIDVISPAARSKGLAEAPADALVRLAGTRPAVAFSQTIAESRALAAALTEKGLRAEHLDGDTPTRERDAILARYAAGQCDVLCNVFVLTEGWDCARAEVCLVARGCSSVSTFIQMVGRVRRLASPSKRALLIDLTGVVHEHGLPDEAREITLDGYGARPREAREWLRQCLACGACWEGRKTPRDEEGARCPRCGAVLPPPKQRQVKRAELGVARVVPRAVKQAEFDRLCQVARERGYKPGWVGIRFREAFGHWPERYRESARAA